MNYSLLRSRLRMWSRETGSAVPSRVSSSPSQAEPGAYLRDFSRVPRRRPLIYLKPNAIGSVPGLSGHANAYRRRSLSRVRRHRASKPQGSSDRVLPWQVTMDQLICTSLFQTHYWYEVGMLKVPYTRAVHQICAAFIQAGNRAHYTTPSNILRTSFVLLSFCTTSGAQRSQNMNIADVFCCCGLFDHNVRSQNVFPRH